MKPKLKRALETTLSVLALSTVLTGCDIFLAPPVNGNGGNGGNGGVPVVPDKNGTVIDGVFVPDPPRFEKEDAADKMINWKRNLDIANPSISRQNVKDLLDLLPQTKAGAELINALPRDVSVKVAPLPGTTLSQTRVQQGQFEFTLSEDLFLYHREQYVPLLMIKEMQAAQMFQLKYMSYGSPEYDQQTLTNFNQVERAVGKTRMLDALREFKTRYSFEFRGDFSEIGLSSREVDWYMQDHDALVQKLQIEEGLDVKKANEIASLQNRSQKVIAVLRSQDYQPFNKVWNPTYSQNAYEISRVFTSLTGPFTPYLTEDKLYGKDMVRVNTRSSYERE